MGGYTSMQVQMKHNKSTKLIPTLASIRKYWQHRLAKVGIHLVDLIEYMHAWMSLPSWNCFCINKHIE